MNTGGNSLAGLSSEQRLALRFAAGGQPLAEAVLELPCLDPQQQDRLIHLLVEKRVAPLVEHRLQQAGALMKCPEALRQALGQERLAWTEEARRQRLVLTQVCGKLEAAAIPVVALKGAHLAWHVYDHPCHRPLRDLDLLIPEHRFPEAVAILEALRCRVVKDEAGRGETLGWANNQLKVEHPLGVWIELHRGLWYYPIEGGVEDFSLRSDFWDSDENYLCRIDGVRFLSEPYRHLHLLVHHIDKHHLGLGPLGLQDLLLSLSSPSLDRYLVERELQAMGAPGLDRIARELVKLFRGESTSGIPPDWLRLVFLTPEQNLALHRDQRSIRRRIRMWWRIQMQGGQWTAPPARGAARLLRMAAALWRAPGMARRSGLQLQLLERLGDATRSMGRSEGPPAMNRLRQASREMRYEILGRQP
jgi:hypothetical protein